MSDQINIRDVEDAFERYKMPRLEVRTKPKGQFSDTSIGNVIKVAKALHVQPECLLRWFGWSLKTQVRQRDSDTMVVKGSFSAELILKHLRKLINGYMLCKKCTLPELNYVVKGKAMCTICRACGHRVKVNVKADRVWKLIHRLENQTTTKKPKKRNGAARNEDQFSASGATADDPDASASAQMVNPNELMDAALNGDWAGGDDDWADDWGDDAFSAEAVEARKQQALGSSSALEKLIQ